jgi:hypothetical protein
MKLTMQLDADSADSVVRFVLVDLIETLEIELKQGTSVFVKNKKRDREIIREHIKAIKLIQKYMGKNES